MKIIKLDAIDSTNSYLKELIKSEPVENFTIVCASMQYEGKGQMGTQWHSEPNKNLLCSVYCSLDTLLVSNQKYLNYAVSISIYKALDSVKVPNLKIKWPNDILSSSNKLAGILIENVIQDKRIKSSIIGIGINVNQASFLSEIQHVTSVFNEINTEISIDTMLNLVVIELKKTFSLLESSKFEKLEKMYYSLLFKYMMPTMFRDKDKTLFLGMIKGVATNGKLQIQVEDESIKEFGIKEVSFA